MNRREGCTVREQSRTELSFLPRQWGREAWCGDACDVEQGPRHIPVSLSLSLHESYDSFRDPPQSTKQPCYPVMACISCFLSQPISGMSGLRGSYCNPARVENRGMKDEREYFPGFGSQGVRVVLLGNKAFLCWRLDVTGS